MSDMDAFVVTCEHGGNSVPTPYSELFEGQEALLESHRGWDPGALPLARALGRRLGAPLFFSTVTRLLVDLNRSLHHPNSFSSVTRALPPPERERILARWYHPYRQQVTAAVEGLVRSDRKVVHLSIHTFTPVLDGEVRGVEIGLLYDPARAGEKALCRRLGKELRNRLEGGPKPLRIRMNQPYRGRSDGFTTWLRRRFPPAAYLGIELEVNQGLIQEGEESWLLARKQILETFGALGEENPSPGQR